MRPKTIHGRFLCSIDKLWMNMRIFLFRRHNLSDIIFVIIYSMLQVLLVALIKVYRDNTDLVVSLFVVLLMSAIAVERIIMNMRYNYSLKMLNDEKNRIMQDKEVIEIEYNMLIEQNQILRDKFDKQVKNK